MRIAILGGGVTGLTAAYFLAKKGQEVSLFEKENTLGGLASGFKEKNWNWYLDKTYHHIFSNDRDILNFSREIGFKEFDFQSPKTACLFENNLTLPLDTPYNLIKFPLLNFSERIQTGLVLAWLKYLPLFSTYEKQTAAEFLKNNLGKKSWKILWEELFRKKFGKYAENVLASFFWARIHKRTKNLGYPSGGFQEFINYLEKVCGHYNIHISKGREVGIIKKENGLFKINDLEFDRVISTLATPLTIKVAAEILPASYLQQLNKINYLHAVNLIVVGGKKLLPETYWLNILAKKIPITVVVQHTNLVDKKYFGNNEVLYLGNYVDVENKIWNMEKPELVKLFSPHLKLINPEYTIENQISYLFKSLWSQPVYDENFKQFRPEFCTPEKNFHIANLDLTYPYDRGTNYAVKLGKQIASYIN